MNADNRDAYYRTNDESGETVLCPIEPENPFRNHFDECVEESTTGRYAANITVVSHGPSKHSR